MLGAWCLVHGGKRGRGTWWQMRLVDTLVRHVVPEFGRGGVKVLQGFPACRAYLLHT